MQCDEQHDAGSGLATPCPLRCLPPWLIIVSSPPSRAPAGSRGGAEAAGERTSAHMACPGEHYGSRRRSLPSLGIYYVLRATSPQALGSTDTEAGRRRYPSIRRRVASCGGRGLGRSSTIWSPPSPRAMIHAALPMDDGTGRHH